MTKILVVKTSSMGDVIHQLPAVTDICRRFPEVELDWVVEEGFAEIPALHPCVRNVIRVSLRRWRRALTRASTWREVAGFYGELRGQTYDWIIDSQGLVKSALITRLARGVRCGYDRTSIREALAVLAYGKTATVSKAMHAVERNRRLAGEILGYVPAREVDYGIESPDETLDWLEAGRPYAVLLHATSRSDKEWAEGSWLELAAHLHQRGLTCVLPGGNAVERERATRLAQQMALGIPAPPLSLRQAATLLGNASIVVGVDTGLTHLAAALGVPVVALYCASAPGLTGVYSAGRAMNLGAAGQPPGVKEVIAATGEVMAP